MIHTCEYGNTYASDETFQLETFLIKVAPLIRHRSSLANITPKKVKMGILSITRLDIVSRFVGDKVWVIWTLRFDRATQPSFKV